MLERHGKEIVLSSLLILLAIAVILVGTYAYFGGKLIGNDTKTSISLTAGKEGYGVEFSGGDKISLSGIYPRTAAWVTKDVTISANMNDESESIDLVGKDSSDSPLFIFGLVVNTNTYAKEDIQYTFTYKEGINVFEDYTETKDMLPLRTTKEIGRCHMDVSHGATVTYTLNVYFVNDPNRNQNTGVEQNLDFYVTSASGMPVEVEIVDGDSITNTTLPKNSSINLGIPEKEGYKFLNWTLASGSDATLSGTILKIGEEKVTLTQTYRELSEFEKIPWATLAEYARNGDSSKITLGATREIDVDGKTYNVRVINNSRYGDECTKQSKTACGLVMEFVESIERRKMCPDSYSSGGWPAVGLYKYFNGDTDDHLTYNGTNSTLFSKLPYELQSVIIDTTVVSGLGVNGNTVVSTDKLFILTLKEFNMNNGYDNSEIVTYTMDYYNGKSIKRSFSWTRSIEKTKTDAFLVYNPNSSSGGYSCSNSTVSYPAFRIG